jgi:hypothetical protein
LQHLEPCRLGSLEVEADPFHRSGHPRWRGRHRSESFAVEAEGWVHEHSGRCDGLEHRVGNTNVGLGEAGEVLDTVDAGSQGVPNAGQGVGMRQDRQPDCVCRVDECPKIGRVELRSERVGADRGHPAAGHHLDHIDAAVFVLGDRGADRIRTLHDTVEVVAVAVGNG